MKKSNFLQQLQKHLEDREVPNKEILDILEDYTMMIDEAIAQGEEEEAFVEKLGSPRDVAQSIRKQTRVYAKSGRSRFIALTPFIAMIIFFSLGFGLGAWHPGWMAFLLIPVSAIVLEVKKPMEKLTALSVFISLIVFMIVSTIWGIWHPMWAIFLLIPACGFFNSRHRLIKWFGVYTLFALFAFIVYTLVVQPTHFYAFFLFAPIPLMALWAGEIDIHFGNNHSYKSLIISGLMLVILGGIYLYVGLVYRIWHPTWLVFLLIPLRSLIYRAFFLRKWVHPVAFAPFISLALFFLVGELFSGYAYSWMSFLLIPITAIVFDRPKALRKRRVIIEHDEEEE